MKIAVISDLHGFMPIYPSKYWQDLAECEMLCICGDIIPLSIQTDVQGSVWWLKEKFKPWLESLPVEKVIFIAGNHDFVFERKTEELKQIFSKSDKVTYLHHDFVDYISEQDSKVYRIFGTPYCKIFGRWAFMIGDDALREKFNQIPDNVDVLLTHDAPALGEIGIIHQGWQRGTDAGNKPLAEAIKEHKPRFVFCGHIHSGDHNLTEIDGVKIANTSVVDERYELMYEPLIIRLNEDNY